MKKINEIPKVISYCIGKNEIYYSIDNNLFIYNLQDSEELLKVPFCIRSMGFFENDLILLDDYNKPVIVDIDKKTTNEFYFNNVRILDFVEDYLIFYRREPDTSGFIRNKKIEFESEQLRGRIRFVKDFVISCFCQFIECYQISSTKLLWRFDLSAIGSFESAGKMKPDEFDKYIAVFENEVWIATRGNKVVIINNYTGELVKVFEWKGTPSEPIVLWSSQFHYSSILKKIIGFHANYMLIDPLTKNIEKKIYTYTAFKELGNLNFNKTLLQNKFISFKATEKDQGFVKYIGIFNIEKEEIISLEKISDKAFVPSMQFPLILNNHLFILDSNQTLHIYKF